MNRHNILCIQLTDMCVYSGDGELSLRQRIENSQVFGALA